MISKTVKVSCIVVALLGSFLAEAQQERKRRPNPKTILAKMDTDENGLVSLDEFKAAPMNEDFKIEVVEKRFKKMDEDESGEVDLEELKKAMKHMKRRGRSHQGPKDH
ncbi:EF-hand domain-containing protein [Winogradskyella sp. DF17]|uniref:EF-hand domain-containing protein n=1 Tax=Winogradskyella pelagia TaxID=2819984 RepID=A0ABS3T4N5_9FLAO|nr:EF-hand domain-containing protein [Winogradskyella sp. DF17]MBO3117710.1 EF-hand domain-containing protein [Winogradskyella sp. DF17]